MTASSLLVAASALLVFAMGTVHLAYTFLTDKFDPRDAQLKQQMRAVTPVLTREMTMWDAWVGFNASHSLSAVLFGAIYGYLALRHADLLFHSWFLMALGLLLLAAYAVLGKRYWFRTPFRGILVSSALYCAGLAESLT